MHAQDLATVLDAIQRNADTAARLLIAAESLRQAQEAPPQPGSSSGNMTVQFGAGGIALWASMTFCAVAMTVAIGALILFVNLDRKVDRAIDYQQANYRSAKQ